MFKNTINFKFLSYVSSSYPISFFGKELLCKMNLFIFEERVNNSEHLSRPPTYLMNF